MPSGPPFILLCLVALAWLVLIPPPVAPPQDMACETFLKICQRCKQQFVKHQPQEQSPFIDQLLIGSSTVADIGSTIADLEAHQARLAAAGGGRAGGRAGGWAGGRQGGSS